MRRRIILGMTVFETTVIITLIFVCLTIITGFSCFLFYENEPLVVNSDLKIEKNEYRSGDDMKVTVDCCRYTDAKSEIFRSWRNGLVHDESPVSRPGGNKGTCDIKSYIIKIPEIPIGDNYRVHYKVIFHVSEFFTRVVRFKSEPFNIIK